MPVEDVLSLSVLKISKVMLRVGGFSPVMCSNESCGMEINKQDKNYHENEVCEYRKVKCEDCGKTQKLWKDWKEV